MASNSLMDMVLARNFEFTRIERRKIGSRMT